MSDDIQIRRARRQDVPTIAALVDQATGSRLTVAESKVMEWLFGKGLVIAAQGDAIVGVAAWQAENLLSVTDVFHVSPEQMDNAAGAQLLTAIEEEANTLMCEANVLLLATWAPDVVRNLAQAQGYESAELDGLHRIWREVLADWMDDEPDLMVKRLRDRMVMVPL
jgi:N-acetylglutamate synthase-like GNAT family acetyltransferase